MTGITSGTPRAGISAAARAFAALATAVLLLGIADSMFGSYAVLFAAVSAESMVDATEAWRRGTEAAS